MWLPETAVDLETLEPLAELGVKLTILAPRQASRVRKIGSRSSKDVSGARIEPHSALPLNATPSAVRAEAEQGNEAATTWIGHMTALADNLDLRVSG
jgi:hypothetical protein